MDANVLRKNRTRTGQPNPGRDGRLHVSASLLLQRDRYFFLIIFHLNAPRSLSRRRIHVSLARRDESPLSPATVSLTDGNRFLITSPSRCLPNAVVLPACGVHGATEHLRVNFAKGPFPRRAGSSWLSKYSNNTVRLKAFSFCSDPRRARFAE